MNIQLANVLSDVSGMTEQTIIKAILAGERDPYKLAVFRDPRVKASEERIARGLEGNWEDNLLFVLKQEQRGTVQRRIGIFLIAGVCGVFSGMFGVGGGVLLIPLLVLLQPASRPGHQAGGLDSAERPGGIYGLCQVALSIGRRACS